MSVYHFWSPKCAPCMRMKSAFAELREEFPSFTWRSINILEDPEGITQKYGVKQIPAMVIVNPGGIHKVVGSTISDYYKALSS